MPKSEKVAPSHDAPPVFRDPVRMQRNIAKNRFRISPRGPFSLDASTKFLEAFTPAAFELGESHHFHIAFPVEGSWTTTAVCVRQTDRSVVGEFAGEADVAAVRRQVARILSLDIDGSAFPEVGRRDPVVGRLQRRLPGLRPVLFWSPYEAAAWAIIGHRIRMAQAARIKQQMAEELGAAVEIHGDRLHAFPSPAVLSELREFPGLYATKVDRLRALGSGALDGFLDADRLRSSPDPITHLKQLPGIGDFSAELILVRGAGEPDFFAHNERRLQRAMAEAYGFDSVPPIESLVRIAENWRPYRSWATLLFRAASGE
jgi:DNA-3-methyladenine glycosylase II